MRLRLLISSARLLALFILLFPASATHAQAQEKAVGFDTVPFTIIGSSSAMSLTLDAPNVVDLKTPGGLIFVSVRISGESYWFLYNPSSYSCIDVEEIKLPVKTINTEIHADQPNEAAKLTIPGQFVRISDILIGNVLINNVDIRPCSEHNEFYKLIVGGPVGGSIGADFLYRWRIAVVDYVAHKLILGKR
jgi:hypothetical protein